MTSDPGTLDSRILYLALVLAVAAMRLGELALSRRNERWLRSRGAVEAGAGHYPWMVALHTAFLVACPLEVWALERPFVRPLAIAMVALLAAAITLRWWVIATLGRRWTTRILCLPGEPLIAGGPYRFARHPNYVGVVVELLALPLIHGAWLTALAASAANAVLLRIRIRAEEDALALHASARRGPDGRPSLLAGSGTGESRPAGAR